MTRVLMLVLGLILFGAGFGLSHWISSRDVERKQEEIDRILRAQTARETFAEIEGTLRQREALESLREHEKRIAEAISKDRSRIERRLEDQFTQMRSAIDAPQFDCLRSPYPDDSLRLLSRPGSDSPGG